MKVILLLKKQKYFWVCQTIPNIITEKWASYDVNSQYIPISYQYFKGEFGLKQRASWPNHTLNIWKMSFVVTQNQKRERKKQPATSEQNKASFSFKRKKELTCWPRI